MFENVRSKTCSWVSAAAAAVGKSCFGAAPPGLEGRGPKADPFRCNGGRAERDRPETGGPAQRRGRSLAAALVWACLALTLSGLFAASARAGVVFEEIPQGHGGTGKSFKVRIFVNPGGTRNVTATNATVSIASVGNSNHAYQIRVTPTSNSDITLRVQGARKRVIRGPDGDARVKNMYIQDARESERDIYLDFYYPKRSYYLSKRAFGLSLHVETHSNAKICFFDDRSDGRCFDNRKTASVILSRDSRSDYKDRTRTWTVRVASMDGTGATTYNVIVGDGPVIPPRALDCTFDVFDGEGLTVMPDLGVVESIRTKGCRRYEITLNDPPIRIENHQFRGTVIELSAPLKQAYVDAGAALFLDWADFYEGRNYSRPLADARPELRLDETILYLRMRLPRGTVNESSVASTSGNGTYEHLVYPIKVVRERGGGSGNTGKHVAGQPLTAYFSDIPDSHDGSTAFTFRLAFSDDVDIEPAEMRDHALTVTDATVTGASRVDGRSDLWEFTVEPAGSQPVAILVPQGRACTEQGALCTSDGRSLSGAKTAQTIPYTGSGWNSSRASTDSSALTATFENVPSSHDGSSGFTLELAFSEAVFDGTESFDKNQAIRDAVAVTGGTLRGGRRTVQGAYDRWTLRVEPSGNGDVTVSLPATSGACSASGAICTPGGTPLSGTATATIEGPSLPALSIADAETQEGPNTFLRFKITLSEASDDPVTFNIATSDGTALAGTDYVAKNRSKTIAAGKTTAWFKIHVIDDSHDEGEETFTVTISNASGATIADGTATGTIKNSDPMPQAWLARFGRTVAEHVVDAVGERLRGAPGGRVTLGGHELDWSAKPDPDSLLANGSALLTGADPRLTGDGPLLTDAKGFGRGLNERTEEDAAAVRELSMPELLLASSFHVSSAGGGGTNPSGRWSIWGRGARSSFEGAEEDLTLNGDVTTATLGADYERERWLLGVALARSSGDGSFRAGGTCQTLCAGEVESAFTGLYPYARYRVSERLSLWGVVGHGQGDLTLSPEGANAMETDIDMSMASAGARGVVLPASRQGDLEIALRADLLATSTSSDAAANLAETEAETSRIRLLLEGSRALKFGAEGVLTPSVELGLRYDGGDAERGSGLEVGSSLRYASGRLTMDLGVRGLLAHSESDYKEWGVSGSIRLAPGDEGRGLSMSLASAWGAASGGAERLWSERLGPVLVGDFDPGARLDAEVAYGLGVKRGLLTPYTGLAYSESGETWRAGARWRLGAAFDMSLEASLKEPASGDDTESGVLLRGSKRW